jgi:hypothetical protein
MLNLTDLTPDPLADSGLEEVVGLHVVMNSKEMVMVAVVDLNSEIEGVETLKLNLKHPQDMDFDIALMQTNAMAKLGIEQEMQEDRDIALKEMGEADLGVVWAQAGQTDILDPVPKLVETAVELIVW